MTLNENKSRVDKVIDKLDSDLNGQRSTEFGDYKTEKKSYADSLLNPEDSETSRQLVENAKLEIETLSYDNNLSLTENKAMVDNIISKLQLDLDNQRKQDYYSYLGEKFIYGNSVCYVSPDGTTSTVIGDDAMVWLKEESGGTYAWYGIDNSSGIFKKGSVFWVKWLNKDENPEEWDFYYRKIDRKHQVLVEEDKLWIFLTGVTAPDGTEYHKFSVNIPYYIQLGSDWDRDDIRAMFIVDTSDENIETEFINNMEFPEGKGEFAKLILKHFSEYAVYDQKDSDNQSGHYEDSAEDSAVDSVKILTGIKFDKFNLMFLNFMFFTGMYICIYIRKIINKK